jgi:hypothetical protein
MKTHAGFILLLLCALFIFTTGCTSQTAPSGSTNVPETTAPVRVTTPLVTPAPPTLQTPEPTPVPAPWENLTNGFWCRNTTVNIGKVSTDVRQCYQFLPDGTFRWGYDPGYPMGRSPSCRSPDIRCEYAQTADGRYEVQGGYFYTLSENALIDPHDPPYYIWSATGIP